MSDSAMVVIGIFVAVVLMFIFPLMSVSERNDDMAQTFVQTEASDFIDRVTVGGKIKAADYEALISSVNSVSGAPYEVSLEVQHFDDNFQSKVATVSRDLVGENARYSTYTTEIENNMYDPNNTNREYVLKKGDNVIVTVRSTSKTIAQMLRSAFYRITGRETSEIVGTASGMVVNNGH